MEDKPLWIWEDKLRRYRNTDTGQFIGIDQMNVLRDQYMARQKSILAGLSEKLRNNQTDIQSFEKSVKQVIKDTYTDMYAMGAGGRNSMSHKDWGKIGSMLKDQYGQNSYLKGFIEQISNGQLSQAQIDARLKMYVNAANESLWKGYASDLPLELPAYPGDGSTVCLTNCQCTWDIRRTETGYDCYWTLGASEHCPDCIENASKWNPYHIEVRAG